MATLPRFLLSICLLQMTASLVMGRSVLLKRLIDRRNSDEYYRQLADFIQLEERSGKKPNIDATKFLEQFGYLQDLPPGVSHDHASRSKAIKKFQEMYSLKATGELDDETLHAMAAPRCGLPDTKPVVYTEPGTNEISRRYFVPGKYKWNKNGLTYHFRNFANAPNFDSDAQRRAIERAFKWWSDVTPLTFRETDEPRGDFNLEFATAAHSDGPQNSFDGPGGVLAHAFYPESGECHFDAQESWVDRQKEGIDLETVAAHELGHALGLGHSAVPGALMAPYYQGYSADFTLPQDDIDAIQSLYGPKRNGGPPPAPKKTTTSTTKTTTTSTTPPPVVTMPDGKPSDTCSIPFRAITQIHDNSLMVFNGQWLWRIVSEGLAEGYPIKTQTLYTQAPSTVDAAIYSRRTYYTYLFSGKMVWKYHGFDFITRHNIATQSFTGSVTDVFTNTKGDIYLIKNNDCLLLDEYEMAVHTQSVPCSQLLPSMPTAIDSTVQLVDEPDYIYFFRGPRYFKYNINRQRIEDGYPKSKAGPWMGPACGGSPYSPK